MHNLLWDTHTISPVLYKFCKLVPVSSPFGQWGVWVHAYHMVLLSYFDIWASFWFRDRKHTHREYLNTSSTEIYLQKMANELRSIRTYVSTYILLCCWCMKIGVKKFSLFDQTNLETSTRSEMKCSMVHKMCSLMHENRSREISVLWPDQPWNFSPCDIQGRREMYSNIVKRKVYRSSRVILSSPSETQSTTGRSLISIKG